MVIEYLGHSCFKITTAHGTTVVTDPYTRVGYELAKGLCADIVTVSHGHFDHNYVAAVSCGKIVDTTAGLKTADLAITGVTTDHDPLGGTLRGKNIVYKLQADGLTLCHLGDLGEPCSEEVLRKIGYADIVFVPVGGTYTVDAVGAMEYISALKPKMAILMHYRPQDGALDIDDAEKFLVLCDRAAVYAPKENRITVTKESINSDKTRIVYLQRGAEQ